MPPAAQELLNAYEKQESGITGVATTIGTGAAFALGAGVIAGGVYACAYGFATCMTPMINYINAQGNSIEFWKNKCGF